MSRLRRHRARREEQVELNITAFMNLMVVLVPFLLVMAVFSRITIHELNLPKESSGGNDDDPPALSLEVIVRGDRIDLADQNGLIKSVPKAGGAYDLAAVAELLKQVKSRFPEALAATVLLEPEVPYDELVAVMDTVRVMHVEREGQRIQAELFPEISIGDAPADGRRS